MQTSPRLPVSKDRSRWYLKVLFQLLDEDLLVLVGVVLVVEVEQLGALGTVLLVLKFVDLDVSVLDGGAHQLKSLLLELLEHLWVLGAFVHVDFTRLAQRANGCFVRVEFRLSIHFDLPDN